MRTYTNPFRSRTSEQVAHQGLDRYLRTFGADALDMLPDSLWDRIVVIASAPGAGKTSLLRVVSSEALKVVASRKASFVELFDRLTAIGALDETGQPSVVGFRVPLGRDFKGIVDLESDPAVAKRLFLHLLDARIMSAFCASVVHLLGELHPAAQMRIEPEQGAGPALERLGGSSVLDIAKWALRAEGEILDRLDSVLPQPGALEGHGALYSLRALSGATIVAGDGPLAVRPLLLLDDGQDLDRSQRTFLLDALHDRELQLARWYTERYSAMEPEDVIGDGEPDRNRSRVRLEREALRMGATVRRGSKTRKFEKLLADISDRRASRLLAEYGDEDRGFNELLDGDDGSELQTRADRAVDVIRGRLTTIEKADRYSEWFEAAEGLDFIDAARRWRELEILIARDIDRPDLSLFDVRLDDAERQERSSSAIREAADLWLRREFGLPFYWGSDRLAKLAAENIEQHLNLSADLFDEMLAGITLRQGAVVPRLRQDGAVVAASAQFWSDIPERRIGGRSIQQFLRHVARLCRAETYRPKASYAPGVTGTALSMRDRIRLLDPDLRAKTPGAQRLFEALHGAIGHNLLRVRIDHHVKNDTWMVLYLNRLTCVRYGLPLGYGGFRERTLEDMCEWMLVDVDDEVEAPVQEALEFR
jgi:hypothetical protein